VFGGIFKPRSIRSRRGNAVLDAALVLPILLSLTFGSIEYGYFFYVKHSLQGAAREGCRVAVLTTADNAQVTRAVVTALHAVGLNTSSTTLDAKYNLVLTPGDIASAAPGATMKVQLDCDWGSFNVRPLGLISSTKVVRGTTVMRREG
jgi:Flp pilus assembly protein TadG